MPMGGWIRRLRGLLGGVAVSLLIPLAIWEVASSRPGVGSFLLPPPLEVMGTLGDLVVSGELWAHVMASLGRVMKGFAISSAAGLGLGVMLGLSRRSMCLLGPLLEFLRHIPPLAVLPLFVLWFGIGEASKVAVIVAASFFPIFLSAAEGVMGADQRLVEVGLVFGLSRVEVARRIIVPCAMPSMLTGLRLGLGYGWRSLIGAELVAATSGLGYLINDAQALSRTDVILAGVAAMGVIGMITDRVFLLAVRRLKYWEEANV